MSKATKKNNSGPSRGKNSKQTPAKTKAKKNQKVNEVAESKANKVGEMIKDGYNYVKQGVITGFNAAKSFIISLWDSIKNFFSKATGFVKGFFNRESLQNYAEVGKMGFLGLLGLTAAYMLGAYIVSMAGVMGLAYVGAGGAIVCVATSKATQYSIDKAEEAELAQAS